MTDEQVVVIKTKHVTDLRVDTDQGDVHLENVTDEYRE